MDPLTFTSEALFALVFVWSLGAWWRRRDALSRDVVLVFVALAAIFVLGILQVVFGPPGTLATDLVLVLLLGQPVFTLRLAAQLHSIPGFLLGAAVAGWLATGGALIVAGRPMPVPLALVAVGVFVTIEVTAAGYLAVAARRRSGAGATRLWVAAVATALLALAILGAASGTAASGVKEIGTALARAAVLLAALGYVVAFVPPAVVRRAWQAQSAYRGLRALLDAPEGRPDAAWGRFLSIAREATGADASVIIVARTPDDRRVEAVDRIVPELLGAAVPGLGHLPEGELSIVELGQQEGFGHIAEAARGLGARVAQVISLGREATAPSLVVFTSHHSLFGEEDRTLLAALGEQAAAMVERRRLAEQLGATMEALQAASQAKSDFLASMSHELRTPLNAIIGFSDLMRREEVEEDGTVRIPLEWVEHVHRGGEHLVELVNDVLDLARVEAGRLDLETEPLEVAAAVAESVAGLRPLAERKRLSVLIEVQTGELVQADRGRLRQILYNLLSNAIKFTPEGGRITVEGTRHGDEFHLSVIDTGIGIAPDDQAAVFDEFRQVGAGAQRTEGSGLGLALTRRLVGAHHGRIALESTPGVGSRFTVVLPIVGGDVDAVGVADSGLGRLEVPVRPTAQGVVLVVEDDPSAARLLRAYLEPEGYGVRVVTDGESALALARSDPPTAILLDVLLPGIDGWEVLRRLKADPNLRAVPVVIVTVVDERDVGLALGAVDYLVKPIDRENLLGSLGRLALSAGAGSRAIRVVAVDDEPASLDVLAAALGPSGFEVLRATGGRAGVDLTRRHQPDVVICDLVMPDLDGFGVVGELQADPETAGVPIIILTAHELSASDKRRLNGKVLAIVTKGPGAQAGLRAWLARTAAGRAAR